MRQLIRSAGAKIHIDLNAFEQVFAKLKNLLRKATNRRYGVRRNRRAPRRFHTRSMRTRPQKLRLSKLMPWRFRSLPRRVVSMMDAVVKRSSARRLPQSNRAVNASASKRQANELACAARRRTIGKGN
uniref:hypothetical protein n=1 Tax=Rhizobium lupini TaxID=136996 RepID=UPI003F653433